MDTSLTFVIVAQLLSHVQLFATHGLQHIRLPCPSLSPGVSSDSCPLTWWCHPTTSSSVAPFSSCPQSFTASRSFPVSWLFSSGGQSIGASASASALPMNIQGWFPLGLTGLISFQSRDSQEPSPAPQLKVSILQHSVFFVDQLSYSYMTTGKTIVMTVWTFVGKVVYLHFNTLSRFVIIFIPRSKCLSILWLQLPSAVILEPNKLKTVTVCIFFFFCLLTMKW